MEDRANVQSYNGRKPICTLVPRAVCLATFKIDNCSKLRESESAPQNESRRLTVSRSRRTQHLRLNTTPTIRVPTKGATMAANK